MQVWSVGQEDPLEKGMETHSGILALRISWAEEPGRLWSIASQRIGHNWIDLAPTHACLNREEKKRKEFAAVGRLSPFLLAATPVPLWSRVSSPNWPHLSPKKDPVWRLSPLWKMRLTGSLLPLHAPPLCASLGEVALQPRLGVRSWEPDFGDAS